MPDPSPDWFFEPRSQAAGTAEDAGDGLIRFPAELLQRHGARILNPDTAVSVPGFPPPRSTVYRARSLLVPVNLQHAAKLATFNQVLSGLGMKLLPGPAGHDAGHGNPDVARQMATVPRPVVLTATEDSGTPVMVDAWAALQALRAATAAPAAPDRPDLVRLERDEVDQIALEHLLVGSAITGSPAWDAPGGLTASPGAGTGPTSTGSYLFSGGETRTPVTVLLDPPERELPARYGRRPVVAVLDTGVRAHPWLDVEPRPGGGYDTDPRHDGDGFVEVDHDIQKAILLEGEQAAASGDQPRQVIHHPWDAPVSSDPLVGELDPALGHGTFIAGIVRQVAPRARVLSVRVMHSDDIIYEGDLLTGLTALASRVALAQATDPAKMVDVVSLSLGYFSEVPADQAFTSALWHAIQVLLDLGVVVVAAAGNLATTRLFYPAAFALRPTPAGHLPVISVGALNPNGSRAVFSDGGRWVTAWASGAVVVSTMPTDINGSRSPELRLPAHQGGPLPPGHARAAHREALDPDDYSRGWGAWSGTSFSAPLLAAHFVRALLAGPADPASGLVLEPCDAQTTTSRARAALASMGWPG
jgi:subtilisin family serine protease